MKNQLVWIFYLCFLFATIQVFAQDQQTDLDPVTVSATISPEKISQTGRNIFVIRGERMLELPVHSLDELLRYLPGIEMQSRGPLGSQSDIVIRGGTFQQVLVLIDGVRVNDPNTGHFSAYIPISPAEIERIEILKGAASSIYGSEAIGGVVHIITKTFAIKKTSPKSHFITQAVVGENSLFSLNSGGLVTDGKTSLGGGILSNNTRGQEQRGTRGSVYAHTASISFSPYISEKWKLSVRYAVDDRKFSAQNFYTSFISDTASEKIKMSWLQGSLNYLGNKNKISFSFGNKKLKDAYSFNPVSIPNNNQTNLVQLLLTDAYQIGELSTLVTGLQMIHKKIKSNDRGNHDNTQVAGFMMLNKQWGENFFTSTSIRVERNQRAGYETVPQLNLSYRKTRFQLRASAGKTIRDADFTERFNNYQKSFVASGRIGNPDLLAERSLGYEAGIDLFFKGNFKVSAGYFQRFHTRMIDYVLTPYNEMPRKSNLSPTGNYALAKNIAKVNTRGIESDLQYSKQLSEKKQIWASLGLVWVNSNSSEQAPSLYLSSHAKFFGNFNLMYRVRAVSFSVNGLYKKRNGQESTTAITKLEDDYFVMNLKTEFYINQYSFSFFAEADNVFNKKYADLLGSAMPGRWLMGGLKIFISK